MNIAVDDNDGNRRLVVVSSRSDAGLELRQPDDPTHEVGSYDVLLSVSGLQARTSVYFYGIDGLPQYISALALEWRGCPVAASGRPLKDNSPWTLNMTGSARSSSSRA